MTQTIALAPVRKSLRVRAAQARAFKVFTAGIGDWWPRHLKIGGAPMKTVVVEARRGGRWYEVGEDGVETTVGKILAWEPPRRLLLSWEINHHWKSDSMVSSEVEITFTAEGADATIVEVEHRKFERLGAEAGASMRKDVDRGWPGVLEHFKTAVEA
jgi:uncharacterized protein YndB with AHSA1/START domain